jgi:Autoinducer binding domain
MMSTTGAVSPLFTDTENHYTEFSADLSRSRTLDQFSRRIHKTVKTLGFSDFVFMRLERSWQGDSQQGLLSSLPPMWWQQYQNDRLYKSDLMIAYGKANTHPIFSSHLYEYIEAAPFELALTTHNRQYTSYINSSIIGSTI